MEYLPSEQLQKIFSFFNISSLIAAADSSTKFNIVIHDRLFLDNFARRRFGLKIDQLPAPCDYEKLLIENQFLRFKNGEGAYKEIPLGLLKIYAMELRAAWFPYGFDDEANGGDRRFVFPWAYDSGDGADTKFGEFKKISALIHAAFPALFEALVRGLIVDRVGNDELTLVGLRSYTATNNYSPEINGMATIVTNLDLLTRQPKVLVLKTYHGDKLYVFVYDDDDTFRIVSNQCDGGHNYHRSLFVSQTDTLDEVRRKATLPVNIFIGWSIHAQATRKCPSFGPLASTRQESIAFQAEMSQILRKSIESAAFEAIGREVTAKLSSSKKTQPGHEKRIINFIDDLYRCVVLHKKSEDCHENRKDGSKKIGVALCRALRRLVNDTSMDELGRYLRDPLCFQLIHSWSWQGKGREKDMCFQMDWKKVKNGKRARVEKRCCMNYYIAHARQELCAHRCLPDFWPAVVSRKAVDRVPELALKLRRDVVEFVDRCINR